MSALTVVDTPIRRGFFGAGLALIGSVVYRELSPYQQPTTNLMNLVVQYQITVLFIYASLLLNHDGEAYTGVLAGVDTESVGGIIAIFQLR